MIREEIRRRKLLRKRIQIKEKNKNNKPVLYVFKSNKYIYANIIENGKVLCHFSSLKIRNQKFDTKIDMSHEVGVQLRKIALSNNINVDNVIFDIGFRIFHGHVKSLINGFKGI